MVEKNGYLATLQAMSHDELINELYNKVIEDWCADEDSESAPEGKPVPYMGWFWRDVVFVPKPSITIATDGEYVAVCESNKWGYPQRQMTEEEAAQFIAFIDEAVDAEWKSIDQRKAVLVRLYKWMQTLHIERKPGDW